MQASLLSAIESPQMVGSRADIETDFDLPAESSAHEVKVDDLVRKYEWKLWSVSFAGSRSGESTNVFSGCWL